MLLTETTFFTANLSLIMFLLFRFYRYFVPEQLKSFYLWSLAVKICYTVLIAALFTFYFSYDTDIQVSYAKAVQLKRHFLNHPESFKDLYVLNKIPQISSDPVRTVFFIKILSLVQLFTHDSKWLNYAWFSAISFCCSWILLVKVKSLYPAVFVSLFTVLFILPAPVIWSCTVLKDSLAFSALLLLTTYAVESDRLSNPLKYLWRSIVPCYFLFRLKFYVLGAVLLIFFPFVLIRRLKKIIAIKSGHAVVLFFAGLITIWFSIDIYSKKAYSAGIAELIFYNYESFQAHQSAHYYFDGLSEKAGSFVPHIPEAFIQGMYMPLPGFSSSLIMAAESWMNLFNLILTLTVVYIIIKEKPALSSVLYISLFYILFSAVAFGFSTPNWGTLSRYKIYYMPLYQVLLLYIFLNSRLKSALLSSVRRIKLF